MACARLAASWLRPSRMVWRVTSADKSTKPPCPREEDPFKKTCKKSDEVPCEKRARGDDCSIMPQEVPVECPKPVEDCTAVVTTAKPEEKAVEKKDDPKKDEEEETQVMLSEPLKPCGSDEEEADPKVVIIGAGLAGLTAASRLATMGLGNITILEATSRAGGRIQSMAFGDTIINTGGVWDEDDVCDADNNYLDNPVLHHAFNYGLGKSCKHIHMVRSMVTECDGSPLPLPASFLALTKMRRIIGVAQTLKSTSPYTDQGRADDYIGLRMQQELRVMSPELRAPAARVLTALAILSTGRTHLGSDDFGPFVSVPGSNVKIPLGCTGVLSPLLQNVAQYIKFCKEVVNISWGSLSGLTGRRALVRTSDGCEYSADFVLFTPSLGVLKEEHERIFCPPLPSSKVCSIQTTPFETVNKVFLYYKQPMSSWRQERIFWRLDEEETKTLKGPLNGLREVKEVFGSERVIAVTLAGRGGAKAETVSEKSLVSDITHYIRRRSGDCAPCPDDVLRTRWCHGKHTRGSRCLGSSEELSQPLPSCGTPNPPVIFFAGEATCTVNPGTTRGAFTSGIREADRILSYLPGNRNEYQATDTCLQLQAALSQ